ncbi:MAG: FG-GAP-like repeat-containing protein [Treponema sp.]|jgi:hypothetical protein|nr:FG-GAP-like repeat-containing protein [Treponema sp.]
MKMRRMIALLGLTAIAVLVSTGCSNPAMEDDGDITAPGSREAHLAMLARLGVDTNPDLPVAPNGKPYNPQVSSRARAVNGPERSLGPLGKIFSRPKREIFVAGYSVGSGKGHALFEDFGTRLDLSMLGQDGNNDSGWAGVSAAGLPRKSVAADLNGDGIDEVVIVTMVESTDKILINKGEYKNNAFTVTQVREFDTPEPMHTLSKDNGWRRIGWSLIAADLNGDGKQECIFTFPKGASGDSAYVYILDNNLAVSQLNIQWYLTGLPAQERCTPMVTAADYDQDGKDEICIIFGLNSADHNARYVILDDKDANYRELQNGLAVTTREGISQGNVVAADFTGDGLPDTVFYGDRNNFNEIVLLLLKTDLNEDFKPVFSWVESATTVTNNSNPIVIPRIAAGDVDGDGKMEVCAGNHLWTLTGSNRFERVAGTGDLFSSDNGGYVESYDVVMGDVTGDQRDDAVLFYGWGRIQIYYYDSGQYKRVVKNIGNSQSMQETGCLPNVDNDSFILRDTGDREMLFSDPHVIAVLASPPYYEGLNEDGDGGTSFGYSKSAGESSSNSFGFSVGASIGHKFELPLIGGTEVEATMKSNFSWAQSNSVEISESWGWNNSVAQDLVIFTAIPFDVYYYEVVSSPPGEEARPGDILTINVPRKLRSYHVPLPTYNAGVPEEHRITVNHTLGNPGSYYTPDQRDEQKELSGNKGLFSTNTQMTAGAGRGSTTINIEEVKGEESSFAFDLETEISAKVTAGSVEVGASAGFSYGYETTSSVSEGTWIEGSVPAIPSEHYSPDLDFGWGLMAYPKRDPNQQYIFVTYWTD